MAKTLSFTDTSPQTVKIGDTTTSFTLVCGNDNVATDLTKVTSITVKLGNASGYLKSATVDPAKLTDPTTGQITVTFTADLMTSLPAGSYAIEVWVVDSTGTSIYPSDGSTGFTITNNIQSTNGTTITTITFDDFVKAMNKAASTIAKGDKGEKGDTGTVDNDGLAKAPAFVELKTQVQNSAVGTNLLTGTSSDLKTKQLTNMFNVGSQATNGSYKIKVVKDQTYTYRAWLDNTKGTDDAFVAVRLFPIGAKSDFALGAGVPIKKGETGYSTSLFTPTKDGFISLAPFAYGVSETALAGWKEEKLEKGSVATDWCPNPSEILTQADYSKIQAAIVALGGSLK
ncbi:collagen-like protein [Lactiplantibacillus plantarum]|uniref:collagen-like protein n=1 Tax=Lactiplantibacillus plantarum TaxID=1590 RepID=UPI001303A90D|nr:collagen-like protein [Lactiplantibacillus plantarum]MCG0593801.1 collagen-like protein [Lactiplantibacillus plantarum]MCG0623009.1 collagen-like protein [Lactiplantibacillus plantarum]MCG0749996.1 collagen-like protein [Lactiplantibacillus plantarum]MCG0758695.1 collagen-like protein [Lactiplantibacillus plantarum]MCG0885795.1 collagen-like protein [Lactiplantibacillus plantarum]